MLARVNRGSNKYSPKHLAQHTSLIIMRDQHHTLILTTAPHNQRPDCPPFPQLPSHG